MFKCNYPPILDQLITVKNYKMVVVITHNSSSTNECSLNTNKQRKCSSHWEVFSNRFLKKIHQRNGSCQIHSKI